MMRYAKKTQVPISRSRTQVQDILIKYGVDEFFFGTSPRGDGIGFKYNGRIYKHNVPMPERTDDMTDKQYEQLKRQRWRILYMSLKMKLEQVMDGGVSFEDQFLAQMCLPDGSTVGDFMRLPENLQRIEKSKMPKLLTAK